jgi:hypothetical protein
MAKTKIPGEYLKDSVVRFTAKAGENITKGQAVYISGISGEVPVVSLADADDTNKMPAFGLAESTVSTNASVEVTSNGTLAGIDTSSYALGDILYISTTAGSLTNDPSGLEASKVQNIGMVQRVHANNGSIKVGGAGRTNATPNLNDGNIFVGNSSNKSIADAFTDVLNDQAGINSSANATAITIDSSERVGIGTDNPSAKLTVAGGSDMGIRIISDADGYASLQFGDVDDFVRGGITYNSADDSLQLRGYNNTTRAIIDSSGNVLVGKTAPTITTTGVELRPNGQVFATQSGNYSLLLNRTTSDGDIVQFRKDNTTVGSIGSNTGDKIYIGTGASGVAFSTVGLLPFSPSANDWSDNALNLGLSSIRWKDLYLSGSAFIDTQTRLGNGSAATPAYSFSADSDSGMFRATTNTLGFSTSGSERMRISSTGELITTSNTTALAASFENTNTSGYGMRVTTYSNATQYGLAVDSYGGGYSRDFTVGVDGNVNVLTGNLVIGTAGKGIDFSATSGTGTSELLDDYEEGTWTGTVSSSTATTVTWGVGNYTKIGNMVYASFAVSVSEQTVGDNYIIVYGPFAQHTGSIHWIGFCNNYNSGNRESGIIINNSSGNTNEWFVGWQSNSTAAKTIRGLIIYQTS